MVCDAKRFFARLLQQIGTLKKFKCSVRKKNQAKMQISPGDHSSLHSSIYPNIVPIITSIQLFFHILFSNGPILESEIKLNNNYLSIHPTLHLLHLIRILYLICISS